MMIKSSGGFFFAQSIKRVGNMADSPLIKVGGQAVLEGVMMRSPASFAVAVRDVHGQIVLREAPWQSLSARVGLLRWPFLRGSVVLLESMVNGISALNFSARVAMVGEEEKEKEEKKNKEKERDKDKDKDKDQAASVAATVKAGTEPNDALAEVEVSNWVIWGTVLMALAMGVGLFVALPHMAVWLGGSLMGRELGVEDVGFHMIVGGVKLVVFLTYISLISFFEDVRRVFMFHGAEHQSIYTYEARQALTVENARKHTPLHPRCGTTFLILVIAISIMVFALAFPAILWLVGKPTGIAWLDQIVYVGIKLPLLFPIAGVAYEVQRFMSRHMDSAWARFLAWPGMLVQRMTTRPPSDDQLEVALTSLRKALWREKVGTEVDRVSGQKIATFADFGAVVEALGEPD